MPQQAATMPRRGDTDRGVVQCKASWVDSGKWTDNARQQKCSTLFKHYIGN